jgi:phosphoglycerol transferase MdoB-like AlkP superfamily enzyme
MPKIVFFENITKKFDRSFTAIAKAAGPLRPLLKFLVVATLLLSLARLGLVIWQLPRVEAVDGFWKVLGFGIRMDMILICYLLVPIALGLFLFPAGLYSRSLFQKISAVWLSFWIIFMVFMEASTPSFILQYDLRPNRIFVEYLNHPKEVALTIWGDFRIQLLSALLLTAVMIFVVRKIFRPTAVPVERWGIGKRLVVFPLVLCLLLIGGRNSFDHRPANPSTAAFSSDHLVNELCLNSAFSVLYAIYRLKDENGKTKIYPKMEDEEIVQRIRRGMLLPPAAFVSDKIPTLHRQKAAAVRQRPMNLVIILEESLGAQYVGSLGGKPLTPELDKLAGQGLWFKQLYATGTRSIRGIEAVTTGFFPSPARSVVKLGLAQNGFFTIARILKEAGYRNDFIYGGESHFDNMRGFLLANGFDRVIDENDYPAPSFRGTWGVSDGDLLRRANEEFTRHGDAPFFALVFTSSNHSPYEIPESPAAKLTTGRGTVASAIRYADYALGEFFRKARASDYWDNTLFLVVADHDDVVKGPSLIPIEHFHIPGLILGGSIKPAEYHKVASQADLPPTLLSLMGLNSEHPMPGHDLLQLPEDFPGRAIMQYGSTHAYMRGDQVVVHAANKPSRQFTFRADKLIPAGQEDPELVKDALATALWPSLAYLKQQYVLGEHSLAEVRLNSGHGLLTKIGEVKE